MHEKNSLKETGDWEFLDIKDKVTNPEKAREIKKLLTASKMIPFKALIVSLPARIISVFLGIILAIPIIYAGWYYWGITIFEIKVSLVVVTLIILIVGYFSKTLALLLNYKTAIRKTAAFVIIMFAGCVISNLYLLFFNGLYNRAGKIKVRDNSVLKP